MKKILKKIQINLKIIKNNKSIKKNIQKSARDRRYQILSDFSEIFTEGIPSKFDICKQVPKFRQYFFKRIVGRHALGTSAFGT